MHSENDSTNFDVKYFLANHLLENMTHAVATCDPTHFSVYYYVSDWLALRLEEKGQVILSDFGFPIWEQKTQGAPSYDPVIVKIYDENKPIEHCIDYSVPNNVLQILTKSDAETSVKILLTMRRKNLAGMRVLKNLSLTMRISPLLNILIEYSLTNSLSENFPTIYENFIIADNVF